MGITYWPLGGRVLLSPKSAHLWIRHSYWGGGRLSPGIREVGRFPIGQKDHQ
jgi:hypothetical protein